MKFIQFWGTESKREEKLTETQRLEGCHKEYQPKHNGSTKREEGEK